MILPYPPSLLIAGGDNQAHTLADGAVALSVGSDPHAVPWRDLHGSRDPHSAVKAVMLSWLGSMGGGTHRISRLRLISSGLAEMWGQDGL